MSVLCSRCTKWVLILLYPLIGWSASICWFVCHLSECWSIVKTGEDETWFVTFTGSWSHEAGVGIWSIWSVVARRKQLAAFRAISTCLCFTSLETHVTHVTARCLLTVSVKVKCGKRILNVVKLNWNIFWTSKIWTYSTFLTLAWAEQKLLKTSEHCCSAVRVVLERASMLTVYSTWTADVC